MHKSRHLILSVLVVAGLSGCVWPVPHKSERSPEVRGRVIDAVTHLPIAKATVALHNHPSIMARTDRTGAYRVQATHNVHLVTFLGMCSSDFPQGKYYGDEVDVSHPLYQTNQIRARQYRDERFTNGTPLVLRDITLIPISKP